jgi:hypothetical protein
MLSKISQELWQIDHLLISNCKLSQANKCCAVPVFVIQLVADIEEHQYRYAVMRGYLEFGWQVQDYEYFSKFQTRTTRVGTT